MNAKPVTLIIGDDEFLVSQKATEVIGNPEDLEIIKMGASELDASSMSNLLSPDLFSARKVVVVTNANNLSKAAQDQIKNLAPTLDDDLRLIICANSKANNLIKLAPQIGANVVRIKKLANEREKIAFARDEAKSHGRRITDEASRSIINAVGGDLRAVHGAILQLASQSDGVLDDVLVRDFFAGQPETTGFMVADAAVSGDPVSALNAIRSALQTGTPKVLIASALISQMRDLTRARACPARNSAEMAALLGMPQWKAEKTQRKLNGWSDKGLALAFKEALATDAAVKGGAANADYALEKAVLAMSLAKRN